jgi:integrase
MEWRGDHYVARVLLRDGTKSAWIDLPVGLSEDEARAITTELAVQAARGEITRVAPPPSALATVEHPSAGATVEAWVEAWLDRREGRGLTSTEDDRGRWRKWLSRHFVGMRMRDVKRGHLEAVVEDLDERVLRGELAWKTARNAWAIVTKMFKDATSSKIRALRVRADNPALGIEPPDKGAEKSKAWLYPNEALQLVGLDRAPIRWRRLFAVAVYTYAREGELEALEWGDVDFEGRTVHIHRAVERRSGEVSTTKSEHPRRIPLEAELVPLLELMRDEATDDLVLDMPPAGDIPERLRRYLKLAGVDREELLTSDATRRALRFHDLRSTGITWMALRGDDPMKIMSRAGHDDLETTMKYIRAAEVLGAGSNIGPPFPPLPASLLVRTAERTESAKTWGQLGGIISRSVGVPSGIRTRVAALKGLSPGPG